MGPRRKITTGEPRLNTELRKPYKKNQTLCRKLQAKGRSGLKT